MYSFTACLRQIILVQQAILQDDGIGGHIESWQDLVMLSAEVKIRESIYKIRIRYMPKLTCNMRIIYDNKILRIKSIANEDERNVVTLIIAERYP